MVGSSDELETEQDSKAVSYQLSALSKICVVAIPTSRLHQQKSPQRLPRAES
jgi:hypothetical protein